MDLKKKMLITLGISIAASVLFIFVFAFTYINNFGRLYNLFLFLTITATITSWSFFSVIRSKYIEETNHLKVKKGTGNRQNRRKRR